MQGILFVLVEVWRSGNYCYKDVFFIDASKEFEKGKNQNNMTEDHIAKILETYQKRENVEKFAHLASFEEIDKEIGEVESRLSQMRSQLVGTTPEAQAELTAYLEKLKEI